MSRHSWFAGFRFTTGRNYVHSCSVTSSVVWTTRVLQTCGGRLSFQHHEPYTLQLLAPRTSLSPPQRPSPVSPQASCTASHPTASSSSFKPTHRNSSNTEPISICLSLEGRWPRRKLGASDEKCLRPGRTTVSVPAFAATSSPGSPSRQLE